MEMTKIRVFVDGAEKYHPAWPADVLREFARGMLSCRKTGKRPTVMNIATRIKRSCIDAMMTDANFRTFLICYKHYVVDRVILGGDARIDIHRQR